MLASGWLVDGDDVVAVGELVDDGGLQDSRCLVRGGLLQQETNMISASVKSLDFEHWWKFEFSSESSVGDWIHGEIRAVGNLEHVVVDAVVHKDALGDHDVAVPALQVVQGKLSVTTGSGTKLVHDVLRSEDWFGSLHGVPDAQDEAREPVVV